MRKHQERKEENLPVDVCILLILVERADDRTWCRFFCRLFLCWREGHGEGSGKETEGRGAVGFEPALVADMTME